MIKKPQLYTEWFVCPRCGKKLLIYSNNAIAKGIFIKCKKCGSVVEVEIK